MKGGQVESDKAKFGLDLKKRTQIKKKEVVDSHCQHCHYLYQGSRVRSFP